MEIWPQTPWGCLTDNSGERLNGIQEVSGSIPLISTKKHRNRLISVLFLCGDCRTVQSSAELLKVNSDKLSQWLFVIVIDVRF